MLSTGIVLPTTPLPKPDPLAPTGATLVDLALQPDGRVVQARLAYPGAGGLPGSPQGVMLAPAVGDEILVFELDNGDCIALAAGLSSLASPRPVAYLGLNAMVFHPGGVELRSSETGIAHGIVMATLLPDMLAALQALVIFATSLQTVTSPATLAAIAPAATTFLTNPDLTSFLASLAQSSIPNTAVPPGVGAAPYASPNNRATG